MSVPCNLCCGGRDALGSREAKPLQPQTAANFHAWLGWPVCRTRPTIAAHGQLPLNVTLARNEESGIRSRTAL